MERRMVLANSIGAVLQKVGDVPGALSQLCRWVGVLGQVQLTHFDIDDGKQAGSGLQAPQVD